jgi:serine/threonine-protein kinase
VLDRLTCKSLERRYPDAAALENDLEDALAIEAARAGHAASEATAVIATLPPSARRRVPLRMRPHTRRAVAVAALGVVAAAVVLVLVLGEAAQRVERGTGAPRDDDPPQGSRTISVARDSAADYDPLGDDAEHADEASRAVDGDPATAWSTETYSDMQLAGASGPKAGVGLYVDARPKVEATSMLIRTPEPGWQATILAAPAGPVPDAIEDWTEVGGGTVGKRKQRFRLDTGGRAYRYYLIWITALAPGATKVEIGDVSLTQES